VKSNSRTIGVIFWLVAVLEAPKPLRQPSSLPRSAKPFSFLRCCGSFHFMCGRYRLTRRRMLEIEHYYEIEDLQDLEIWKREYNIPPREMAPIVLKAHGRRCLSAGLWSLLGPWAETLEHANRASTFNAKAETLADRPAYRNAFLKRRCVVPAEAFYEWVGPKKARQPLNIARKDGKLLSMAGLFNYWKPAASEGRPMLTFTVVTTAPNQWMTRIHNRMPVILEDDLINTWLDPAISDPRALEALLKAPPESFLECYPVSRKVNSVRFDEPEYAERIDLDWSRLIVSDASEKSTESP